MSTNNAHLRRNSPGVIAEDTRRILQDPAVRREFEKMEREVVNALAGKAPATADEIEIERELCRTLRTIRRLQTGMGVTTQLDDLREAEFQPLKTAPDAAAEKPAVEPYVAGIAPDEKKRGREVDGV